MDTKRAIRQLKEFEKLGKNPEELRLAAESWKNDFQILVSIILSARTRDETTIIVAEKLFEKYPTAEKLASANISDVMNLIKSVNFYKNKTKSITQCAKVLVSNYKGNVPHDFEKLIELPGVGRKTANVFLAEQGQDAVGVDTHLGYASNYLGWTLNKNPHKIEEDLKQLFPKKYWRKLNPITVRFGKTYTNRKEKNKLLDKIKEIR